MLVSFIKNKAGATSGAGTAYPSGAPEFTRVLCGSHYRIYSFLCGVSWIVIGVFVLLAIALHVFLSEYDFWLPLWYL